MSPKSLRKKTIYLQGENGWRELLQKDSDIDLLVLLSGPIRLWKELTTIVDSTYSIQLDVERPIHAVPANIDDYESGKCALYRNIKNEGRMLR